jgi:hypothetical protein
VKEESYNHLHRLYCAQSGLELGYSMLRHFQWQAFVARGFTADDLTLVLVNLRRYIQQHRLGRGCLSFHRLIGDLETFEEYLAEFRALRRKGSYCKQKQQALRATGRPDEPAPNPPKSAKQVLERADLTKAFADLRKKISW